MGDAIGKGMAAPPAIDALDALAIQSQHFIEAAQLHAVDAGTLVREVFQDADVEANLVVELAAHEPLEKAHAARRPRPARLRVRERRERRALVGLRREEDVQ